MIKAHVEYACCILQRILKSVKIGLILLKHICIEGILTNQNKFILVAMYNNIMSKAFSRRSSFSTCFLLHLQRTLCDSATFTNSFNVSNGSLL